MYNKNKKPTEIRPAEQKSKDKSGDNAKKETTIGLRGNKDSKQAKSDMQSEGGRN